MDRIPAHVSDQAVDSMPESQVKAPADAAAGGMTPQTVDERVLVGAGTVVASPTAGAGAPPAQRFGNAAAHPAPAVAAPPWAFGPPASSAVPEPGDGAKRSVPQPPVGPSSVLSPSVPLFGPVGRRRSILAMTTLSVVTFGIYALVWHRRVNREMEEFDPKLHARPARSTLAVAIPWLVGVLTTVAGAALILVDRFSVHLSFDPHITVTQAYYLLGGVAVIPYLVLILPFSAVAVVMTLERLRCVEEHVGLTADRQVRAVGASLLLLVPIIGGLLLVGIQQRRLNAVWGALTPTGRSSN